MAGLFVLALATQPWWLAPIVARQLAGNSGRTVRIERLWVGVSTHLAPVLHFRGVSIDNAPWADASWPLIEAREVVAVLSWRSFWEERRIVSLLVLRDARIDLERQADGLRNWRLRDPEDRGPGRYRILALQAERSSLRLVHGGVDLLLQATAAPNAEDVRSEAGPALPSRLSFTGQWRKLPFTAEVAAGPVLTFYATGKTFALRGHLETGGTTIAVDGSAGDILQPPLIDARVRAEGPSLAPFRAFAGALGGATRPYRIEARLKSGDRRYELAEAKAKLGGTDLAGSASFDLRGDRPSYAADLHSSSADLADWQWLAGPHAAATSVAAAPSAAARAASVGGGVTAALRGVDGQLRYAADRLRAAAVLSVQSLKVEARLASGRLAVPVLDLGLAGGHVRGQLAYDAANEPAQARAELSWAGLRLESMLHEQKPGHRLTGAVRGQLQLHSSGSTLAALLAGASGDAQMTLTGGSIGSLLDAEMGLQGGKFVRSLLGGSEPIALRCASVEAHVDGGRGQIRSLVIDSERTRSAGKGSFDLGRETADLVLTPEAKQASLFVLDRSIRLAGSIRKPDRSLIDRVAMPASPACR